MTIAWINKMNRKVIKKKGEELKDMQGMKGMEAHDFPYHPLWLMP